MKLILEAKWIPDGTEVTKPTGEKKYILQRVIRFFSDEKGRFQDVLSEGIVFLVAEGQVNAYPELGLELGLNFSDLDELHGFISDILGECG